MLLLLSLAVAGPREDLLLASDPHRPLAERQAAFDRMATPAETAAVVALVDSAQITEDQRWVLVRTLGKNPSDEARAALLELAHSTSALTRMAAVEAMADRNDRGLSATIAARLEDPAILVRAAACDALGRLGDPDTLPDLDRALADPTNHYRGQSLWVRRRMVEAMGLIGTDAAVAPLARALDDRDPEVVRAAIAGLERVAGFSYAEGRSEAEQIEAWRRWARR